MNLRFSEYEQAVIFLFLFAEKIEEMTEKLVKRASTEERTEKRRQHVEQMNLRCSEHK